MLTLLTALALSLPKEELFLPLHEEAGVKVLLAKTETHPWIRGLGLVAASPEKVALVLKDFGRYKEIFKGMIETSQVLKTEGPLTRLHLFGPSPSS